MTFQTLASIDLQSCTKAQLKTFIKLARQDWDKAIDLRSASLHDLIEYLTMYLAHKAATEEPVATEATDVIEEAIASEALSVAEDEDDVIGGAAATVTDAIFNAKVTLSDFEGIDQVTMEATDWTAATPLSCDVLSGQVCDLPEPEIELVEVACPVSFNNIARSAIDIILYHSDIHGTRIDAGWLCGILADCVRRSIRPELVKEPLLLEDHIFHRLAGLSDKAFDTLKGIVRRPEEFGNLSPESRAYHDNISSFIGCDGMSEMLIYHLIRDNLNYLQQRFGISSLEVKHCAIRDNMFSYQDYNSQLQILPSDRRILKLEAPRIAAYFESLTSDYQLFKELDDESLEPLPEDFDLQAMMSHSFGCDYCWLYAESFEWEPYGDGFGGHMVARLDPDKISLSLNSWDGSEYVSFMRLVAQHPDPARRPWIAK